MKKRKKRKIKKRKRRYLTLQDKAFAALKEAVKEVVERHKKEDRPLAVWKDGKVKLVKPWNVLSPFRVH